MYRAYLGRGATDSLSDYWVSLLQTGTDEAHVAAGILSSNEFAVTHPDPNSFVSDLYVRTLGRQGDPDGIAYWTGQLNSGINSDYVALAFLRSREASMLAEESLYQALFNRPGDPLREYWIGSLAGGGLSMGQVFAGFLASPEFAGLASQAVA
jgi:hypothetical protein